MRSKLDQLAQKAVREKSAPSIQIHCSVNGKTIIRKKYGKPYQYFDIASLTKMVFTTPVIIQLVQEGKLSIDDPVAKHLGYFSGHPIGKLKVKKLLDQTSGIIWWRPFYKTLFKLKPSEKKFALRREKP